MGSESFITYVINQPYAYWWKESAGPFLAKRGWHIFEPSKFSFESSGRPLERKKIRDEDYCLQEASIVVQFHGEPSFDSVFEPSSDRTIVDDMLAFMSLYSGKYCQYLWKESRLREKDWSALLVLMVNTNGSGAVWAAAPEMAIDYFQRALGIIPEIDKTQLRLAMRWFFSALKEFELEFGRPLLESALNWVCLESQANSLGITGSKLQKVSTLLLDQKFPTIPRLRDFYLLRNDAFHDGELSSLREPDAQAARTAGRTLVRASVLKLLGMDDAEFDTSFSKLYLT